MPMREEKFKQCLLLYGTDIGQWPEELQTAALRAQQQSTCRTTMLEQRQLDAMLHKNRAFEPARADLAERIINAARRIPATPTVGFIDSLKELLAVIMPKPAFALAGVLALGIIAGFSVPAPGTNDSASQTYFADEESML